MLQFSDPDLKLLDVPLRFAFFAAAFVAQVTHPAFAVLFKLPLNKFCGPSRHFLDSLIQFLLILSENSTVY